MSTSGSFDAKELAGVLDAFPVLRGRRSMVELSGGTGNHTFRVRTATGGDYAVRVPDAVARERGVDWQQELVNARMAAAAGVAPVVVGADPEIGVLVTEFIDGQTLDPSTGFDEATLTAVANTMRRLHAIDGFVGRLDVAAVHASYLNQVRRFDRPLPSEYLEHDANVRQLLRLLADQSEPLVACHNDVNPTNVLRAGQRLWLIDFEYSARGEASFDLGNVVNEAALDDDDANVLVDAYWGGASARLRARVRAWSIVAAHVWVLWDALQNQSMPERRGGIRGGNQQRYQSIAPWLAGARFDALCQSLMLD